MVDRQAGRVFLDQHERGAIHGGGVRNAQPLGDGSRQVRLAGAELADERDHRAGKEQLPEPPAEGLGRGEVGDVDSAVA